MTEKGEKIMRSMKKTYKSSKKAKNVFYAMKNAGKLKGVEKKNPKQSRTKNPVLSAAGKKGSMKKKLAAIMATRPRYS